MDDFKIFKIACDDRLREDQISGKLLSEDGYIVTKLPLLDYRGISDLYTNHDLSQSEKMNFPDDVVFVSPRTFKTMGFEQPMDTCMLTVDMFTQKHGVAVAKVIRYQAKELAQLRQEVVSRNEN